MRGFKGVNFTAVVLGTCVWQITQLHKWGSRATRPRPAKLESSRDANRVLDPDTVLVHFAGFLKLFGGFRVTPYGAQVAIPQLCTQKSLLAMGAHIWYIKPLNLPFLLGLVSELYCPFYVHLHSVFSMEDTGENDSSWMSVLLMSRKTGSSDRNQDGTTIILPSLPAVSSHGRLLQNKLLVCKWGIPGLGQYRWISVKFVYYVRSLFSQRIQRGISFP